MAKEASLDVESFHWRQANTIDIANGWYTVRTNRPPPDQYPSFYAFAKNRTCLINEYDQVHRDFEPFYQLEELDPGFFRRRLDQVTELANTRVGIELQAVKIQNHTVVSKIGNCEYGKDWRAAFERVSPSTQFLQISYNYYFVVGTGSS